MSTKAERICKKWTLDPNVTISELARQFNTSRSQIRRVLRRYGVYDTRNRHKFIHPIIIKQPKIKEVEMFISDLHIPHHDRTACGVMYSYMLNLQPDIIYIGGDVLDFHKISFFTRDPEEIDIVDEIEQAKDFFAQLREDFPNAKIYLEGGNHVEGRWERYLSGTQLKGIEGLDIDTILGLQAFDIIYVSAFEEKKMTGKFPKIGGLYHLHGHEASVSYNGVNVARTMFLRTRENVIFGHFHKTQEYYTRDMNGDVRACWSVGCLCDLTPRFRPINDWNHGFAVIYHYENGTFEVHNKKIIDGKVL